MPAHRLAHRPNRSRPRHAHNPAPICSPQASATGAPSEPLLTPLSFNIDFSRSSHAQTMTSISSTPTKPTTPSNCRSSRKSKRPYSALNGSLGFLAALPFLTHLTSAQSVVPKPRPTAPTEAPVVPSPRPPPVRTTTSAPPPAPLTTTSDLPTTTTTTVKTFSDNVITIAPATRTESSKTRVATATGKPYGVIPEGDQNGGLMLTISLAVVFSVLVCLGLVVFCLFRRRSAKRRMHIFGKSHSHDLLEVIGRSHNKHSSNNNLGNGEDSIRRLSSNEAALQEMSEQSRKSVRLSRRSSSQSLGQGSSGNRMLSPRLSAAARPHSSSHWSGSSGPRGNSASNSIVIGSGEYVAGPLESSGEFRNSQYDDYNSYGGLPQAPRPLYPGPGGGSSSYNSNEQLLLHQQQHPFQHASSYSSADLSRCSSLSTGLHPQPHPQSEPIYLPSPLFRAKTLQTGSYPGSSSESLSGPPHRPSGISSRNPSADSGSSLPPHMANAHLQEHSRPRSMPMLNGMGTAPPSHLSRHMSASMGNSGLGLETMHPERPHSMMPLNNSSSNLVIPPSITTRPRSVMTNPTMHPGQPSIPGPVHLHQQQQQQSSTYYAESPYPLQNYSNSNSNHNSYFPPPPVKTEPSTISKRGSGPIVMVAPAVAPSPARVSVPDQGSVSALTAAPTSGAQSG